MACSGQRTIAVQILVPDLHGGESPLPGALVTVLPYDRDSLLAAMERQAPTPRPHTEALDSLFHAFRAPFLAFVRAAWDAQQIRQHRDALTARLDSAGATPGAGELWAQLRAAEDSLRRLEPGLRRARDGLDTARDTLWPRIERLRSEVKRWKLTTFSGYDTTVRGIARDRLRLGLSDTTGPDGWVRLVLTRGTWWLTARSPDPQDPNAEWYWNVPATGDTIRLTQSNARHLPRY